ncbi:5'-nucleotidase C-terminal domain-containing protein [uncultured Roseobacter sp.]|uniref:5'-nucleotidase C-terminal domain-containing protein n=1 Tax=uncultured Roseobacter sp. TaxID=114847 RepID=UPI002630FC2F|nr:5'-nucleotidase C-terminal domain-containing protein [uncultured Roseobacter sp.]
MRKLNASIMDSSKTSSAAAPRANVERLYLRVLATSDLHMQLIAYDYVKDRQTDGESLARLATLIRSARSEAESIGALCLLLDNGDTLQGNPLGAFLAKTEFQPNPMVTAMNTLGYDAVGLGNHDFDHGIAHLARCIQAFDAPVVGSNVTSKELPGLTASALLERDVQTTAGASASLRIGIISALPKETATWNRQQLDGLVQIDPPVSALQQAADQLKSDGADIVIALAHMGIALFDEGEEAQNRVAEVAALPHVDVVIAGHTHLRFPGPDHQSAAGANSDTGLISGTPVVMPGSGGSDLGVIDVCLQRDTPETFWTVSDRVVTLRPLTEDIREDPTVATLADDAHLATRKHLAQPVARITEPMHSYFALASPSPVTALMAAAKRYAIAKAVEASDLAQLPLIAAAATPATGGFDGPGNFITLPSGQLEQRHVAGLVPYANQVWAVKATGARIAGWLERSALIFNVLRKDRSDQMLIDPKVPGFRYDALYGLHYKIDLTAPSRFDAAGRPLPGERGRVSDITWQGAPVDPDQEFLVAVTDHRAGGGGMFRPFEEDDIVVRDNAPLDRALIDYLSLPSLERTVPAAPWQFRPAPGVTAILHTAPNALNHLDDIAHMAPEPCGFTQDGFARLRLHL